MNSQSDRSIPDLLSDAFGQLAKLIGNEFDLAKAELSQKARQLARGVTMIGLGAVIMIPAIGVLLLAVAAALMRNGFSDAVAYLITGGGAIVAAVGLIAIGFNRLSSETLKPTMTLDQIDRDRAAAKEMIQ